MLWDIIILIKPWCVVQVPPNLRYLVFNGTCNWNCIFSLNTNTEDICIYPMQPIKNSVWKSSSIIWRRDWNKNRNEWSYPHTFKNTYCYETYGQKREILINTSEKFEVLILILDYPWISSRSCSWVLHLSCIYLSTH